MLSPKPPGRVPLSLKILFTLFICVLVPAYWSAYGPANFLWGSDIALFFICVALWLEHPLPNSMMAVGLLPFEIVWCIDLLSGAQLTGSTTYMFEADRPLHLKALSLFHAVLPVVMVFLLRRLGYDRRALIAQTLLVWIVLPATYLLTDPANNVNFAYGPGKEPQTWLHPMTYLALEMILLPVVVCLPMHMLLGNLFGGRGSRHSAIVDD